MRSVGVRLLKQVDPSSTGGTVVDVKGPYPHFLSKVWGAWQVGVLPWGLIAWISPQNWKKASLLNCMPLTGGSLHHVSTTLKGYLIPSLLEGSAWSLYATASQFNCPVLLPLPPPRCCCWAHPSVGFLHACCHQRACFLRNLRKAYTHLEERGLR